MIHTVKTWNKRGDFFSLKIQIQHEVLKFKMKFFTKAWSSSTSTWLLFRNSSIEITNVMLRASVLGAVWSLNWKAEFMAEWFLGQNIAHARYYNSSHSHRQKAKHTAKQLLFIFYFWHWKDGQSNIVYLKWLVNTPAVLTQHEISEKSRCIQKQKCHCSPCLRLIS